ncbi:MAG: PorP/SprF family type IX secretion system membrane protein [Brumimicrobium sp.]
MKKILLITCILLNSISITFGQDIHFSQMRFSPLNLNPALAGAEQSFQAVVNYRDQWRNVATPYQTIGASVDGRLFEKKRGNGFLAGGLNFFNDQAGDVRMTTTNVNLSVAYHLNINNQSTIGAAIQGGFGQRGLQGADGVWSNQFDETGFDKTISSGENFESMNFTHLDAGAGFVYHYKKNEGYMRGNNQFKLTAGIAAFHVNRPSSSFLAGGDDALAMRYSAFVTTEIGIQNTGYSVLPALYYNLQGPHQEILGGTYFRFIVSEASRTTGFKKEFAMSLGAFYRFGDAAVAKMMLEYSSYSFGVAYDFNVSSLTEASQGRGGIELFLRFVLPNPFGGSARARIN